jgi:uncharacterized protein (DUF697 family)/GTP-binding protein EngB required for normal cell division
MIGQDTNVFKDLLNKTKEEIKNLPRANIMIIGKTGIGKSTLINNVFRGDLAETGVGRPVTKHLRKITKEGVPVCLYDTKGLELNEEVQKEIKKEIKDKIQDLYNSRDEKEFIHAIWYCINSNSNRIEEVEVELINEFAKEVPVILVLTQSFGQNAQKFKDALDDMNLNVRSIQQVLSEPYIITPELTIPAYGLVELVGKTYEILPEGVRKGFINAQKVDIERKVKAATVWATGYVSGSFGAGFAPIPFSDAAIIVPLQIGMLAHITAIFGISLDRALLSSLVTSIGGIGGATFLGRYIVANLLKLIPGVGTITGGLISGGTASILTTALALSYIKVMGIISRKEFMGEAVNPEEIGDMLKKLYEEQLRRSKV